MAPTIRKHPTDEIAIDKNPLIFIKHQDKRTEAQQKFRHAALCTAESVVGFSMYLLHRHFVSQGVCI